MCLKIPWWTHGYRLVTSLGLCIDCVIYSLFVTETHHLLKQQIIKRRSTTAAALLAGGTPTHTHFYCYTCGDSYLHNASSSIQLQLYQFESVSLVLT